MVNYLNSMNGFGITTVTRNGDCSGYQWNVKWNSGGDKPPMSIVSMQGNKKRFIIKFIWQEFFYTSKLYLVFSKFKDKP